MYVNRLTNLLECGYKDRLLWLNHYSVTWASQITCNSAVYSTACSGEYQWKHQNSLWLGLWASQWRQNEHDGVSNNQGLDCLLNRVFRRRSKKTSKFRVTGLCEGNSPVTSEFLAQRASNTENVSIWWCHHGNPLLADAFPHKGSVMREAFRWHNAMISWG